MTAKLKKQEDKINGLEFIEVWNKRFRAVYDIYSEDQAVGLRSVSGEITVRQVRNLTMALDNNLDNLAHEVHF